MGAVPYLLFNLSSAGEEAFTLRLLIRNMNDRAIYSLTFFCNEIKVFRGKKWQVKKEISAFSSTSKLSFIWLTRLSAMKALRDPCVHTTLLSPIRRESQDVLIKQAAKSFTPCCCNLLSYICVLLIRVTSLRYNSGSKYQYVVLTQRCAPPQTCFPRIRKVRTKLMSAAARVEVNAVKPKRGD